MTSDLLLFLSLHFATFLIWFTAVFLANEIFLIESTFTRWIWKEILRYQWIYPRFHRWKQNSQFFSKNNFAFQSLEVQDVLIVILVAQYLSVHFGNDSEWILDFNFFSQITRLSPNLMRKQTFKPKDSFCSNRSHI